MLNKLKELVLGLLKSRLELLNQISQLQSELATAKASEAASAQEIADAKAAAESAKAVEADATAKLQALQAEDDQENADIEALIATVTEEISPAS